MSDQLVLGFFPVAFEKKLHEYSFALQHDKQTVLLRQRLTNITRNLF